jgi:hypothetical protein
MIGFGSVGTKNVDRTITVAKLAMKTGIRGAHKQNFVANVNGRAVISNPET